MSDKILNKFLKYSGIFIAGHNGMVGSSIKNNLIENGVEQNQIITKDRSELDLTNQAEVLSFFKESKIDYVILAAAKVGGISANYNFPAEFIYENLMIQSNIIFASKKNNIQELLFLGSSCIYPRKENSKLKEEHLLSAKLEKTNEPYAIAKIAGIKMCESFNRQYGTDYRSIMPTNLYGVGDNYHPENSHVIPGLIRRFHDAKINNNEIVEVWGTGKPRREFLNVRDLAEACIHIMSIKKENFKKITEGTNIINVGSGTDITIEELAYLISETVGFKGKISFKNDDLDGVPQKLLDVSKITTSGWKPKIDLVNGLRETYKDFLTYN